MDRFEIKAKDGLARLGKFTTDHGTVTTPTLMPVIHPGKSSITPTELVEKYGFQMVITNSYIIKSHEKFRDKALSEGVHGLLDFKGPVMTDSGTFQMYYHGLESEEIDPLEIVEFQREIGSDIGTILDVFSDPNVGRMQVEKDTKVSIERAEASVGIKGNMMLAGTIQGGVYEDLREKAAKSLGSLAFDVHPIGGVVPLMERYRYRDIVRATLIVKQHLPPNRPVHLFGCGHPMLFAQAAYLGCDFFDSASYAKFAEAGRMLLPSGTIHLQELKELPCDCPVCSKHTVESLRDMSDDERKLQLMKHNLYVSAAEMRRVRQAIVEGKLFDLVAIRSRSHPTLLDAFRIMLKQAVLIEKSHPVANTSAILFTGWESLSHPSICRFHRRVVSRYPFTETDTLILVPHLGDRPYSETTEAISKALKPVDPSDAVLFYVTPFGLVPSEYEHIHPAQQCVFPKSLDQITLNIAMSRMQDVLQRIQFKHVVWYVRDTPTDVLKESLSNLGLSCVNTADEVLENIERSSHDWWHRKLDALFAYQWNITSPKLLGDKGLSVSYSKSTGKIRHVELNGDILFTLVPTTGLLIPTLKGGKELQKNGISRRYMVMMEDEASEFVAKGKSALTKFVYQVDPELKAGEEVIITDTGEELVGVGRTMLSGPEMIAFQRGVAVTTKHSIS